MQLPVRPAGAGSSRRNEGSASLPKWLRSLNRVLHTPPPPWVRSVLLVGIPVVLLIVLAISLLAISGGTEVRSLEQSQYDTNTGSSSSSLVAQSFYSPRANLSRVDVQLGAISNLAKQGEVRLVVGDATTGTVAYRGALSAASFTRDPFLSVEFPPIAASAGVTYTIVFETPGSPLTSAFAVRYNSFDVLSAGEMYTDAGPTSGDMVLETYYRYGLTDLLADLASAVTDHGLEIIAWVLLLLLPGLALLLWLPGGLSVGQSVLASPGLTALALPVLLLVLRVIGLPLGGPGLWLILLLSVLAIGARIYRSNRASNGASLTSGQRGLTGRLHLVGSDLLFWGLLALVFIATIVVRMLSLRDESAGMGLDAYHHTLIAQMIVNHGGIPSDYAPFAPLASFTYHYGFHTLIASVAWVTGLTRPEDLLLLMPQVGQFATALPVLTLTLFGWRVLNNRWAGLIAGALVGIFSIFPAYYVNWSRYTQGLGLALLPVAWVLFLNVMERAQGVKSKVQVASTDGSASTTASTESTMQAALRNLESSGPYVLGVIAVAGLFLTHYRIAMIFAALAVLYVAGRVVHALLSRSASSTGTARTSSTALLILRRALLAGVLCLAALSPWLVNLVQNFRSHLVGQSKPTSPDYYDLTPLKALLTHNTMWALYIMGALGLLLAFRKRAWSLVLFTVAWGIIGLWSNPYVFDWIIPGSHLPYAGYLDVTTWVQSVWLPLGLLSGFLLAEIGRLAMSISTARSGAGVRAWRISVRALASVTLLVAGAAVALPIAFNLDSKPYIAPADEAAMLWMRDNLPRDSFVLANPFRFPWADAIYGSDSGMWVPLVAGVPSSVPPLPAYNERLADPKYLDDVLDIIAFEPFTGKDMQPEDWQGLKDHGVTDIYVGTRGGNGALDVPMLLASDHTTLLFHRDGAYLFQLK